MDARLYVARQGVGQTISRQGQGTQGTGHSVKTHSGKGTPVRQVPVYGGDGAASFRRKAQDSDAEDRKAWAGRQYGSAYAAMVNLPESVNAKDYAQARLILTRVRKAIDRGHWTKSENGRLHRIEAQWQARAEGRNATFNLRGWKRMSGGDNRPVQGWAAISSILDEEQRKQMKARFEKRGKRGF